MSSVIVALPSRLHLVLFDMLCGVYVIFYNFTQDLNDSNQHHLADYFPTITS